MLIAFAEIRLRFSVQDRAFAPACARLAGDRR